MSGQVPEPNLFLFTNFPPSRWKVQHSTKGKVERSYMPGRNISLANGEIYHILNRGVNAQNIFYNKNDYERAVNSLFYYQNQNAPVKFSRLFTMHLSQREEIFEYLNRRKDFLVEIIAYCLMPDHFHLILKQLCDNGISKFMSDFTNSYTKYFNTRNERSGHLQQGRFKAVRVESDEQLWHLSRYIHLNPYSSYIIKTLKDLANYKYSSFGEYIGVDKSFLCNKEIILANFKDEKQYKNFVFDNADYQRNLQDIKKLILE